ncbi:hypothetical protein Tco_0964808 [Tanacetum coccineum]
MANQRSPRIGGAATNNDCRYEDKWWLSNQVLTCGAGSDGCTRYALIDANKKVDLENPLCPDESRILANILQNHLLRFSIAVSSLVPWIYLRQFWHTLQEDGSKNKLKFMLDRKELTLTRDDFRTIFHLPHATDNNHDHFVHVPKFSEMVSFYINNLGFTLEL